MLAVVVIGEGTETVAVAPVAGHDGGPAGWIRS